MKIHIYPQVDLSRPDPGNGGIERVVRGQYAAFPGAGMEIVDDPEEADVILCHVEIPEAYLARYPSKPIVTTCHGAYWTDGGYNWGDWAYAVNQNVLAAVRASTAMVGVSDWVSQSLRRASMRPVTTIYHGIALEDWPLTPPEDRGNYVLWNKTRVDPVCDVTPLNQLARMMPRNRFVSTFGDERPNVTLVGRQSHAEAADWVRHAGVYLATTRETFGIGTLEAMACGVPVVGYAFGGQREFIEHGLDGWLVQPGDVEGLAEGVQWALAMRDRIAPLARAKAAAFTIESTAQDYRVLFDRVLAEHSYDPNRELPPPRTSIVVTAYNMGDYLADALASVAAQDDSGWECIVINDASPDPRDAQIASEFASRDLRFRSIVLEQNGYLANARNVGVEAARGRYVLPLDADDLLAPDAVRTLADALDADRTIHITYGGVQFVAEDGKTPVRYEQAHARGLPDGQSGWPVTFRLDWMLDYPGQLLPYASMFRREVHRDTGGYRTRSRSSEDQDFWLRASSYGYVPRMVTTASTLIYRVRPGSMSATEGWEEHRPWFPWVADRSLLPAAAFTPERTPRDRAFPALDPAPIAVIIPVGPGHGKYVLDAIDSVDAQTFRNWECVVVNDSGEPLPALPSWVRVVERACCDHDSGVHSGPGGGCSLCGPNEDWEHDFGLGRFGGVARARNAGIEETDAPLFLPLDADDYLQPQALQVMLDAYLALKEPAVIYPDFWEDPDDSGRFRPYATPDYDPRLLTTKGLIHAVTALTPRAFWAEVGGYDPELAWEDWAFALALAAKGRCSRRVAAPLFTYRKHTGLRRNANLEAFEESRRAIMARGYWNNGGELLACRRCPGGGGTTMQFRQPAQGSPAPDGTIFVRYTGSQGGAQEYRGRVTGFRYRFGSTRPQGWVYNEDRAQFEASQDFEIIEPVTAAQADVAMDAPALVAARTPAMVGAQAAPAGVGEGVGVSIATPSPVSPQAEVIPASMPAPAPVVLATDGAGNAVAVPQAETTSEAVVVNDPVSVTSTAVAEAQDETEGESKNPQIASMAHHKTRAELNRMATELGLTGVAEMPSKVDVATAIFVKQQMG